MTTEFKRYDVICQYNLHLGNYDHASFIAIVTKCDNKKVSGNIIWSRVRRDTVENAWFLGDSVEFKINEVKNGKEFPIADLLGQEDPYFRCSVEMYAHQKYKKSRPVTIYPQINELVEYIKTNDKKENSFSRLIHTYFDMHNLHDNYFLNLYKKDEFKKAA